MAIPNRQIGGSTRTALLWQISKQLERLICVRAGGCPTTTTTTSTITPTTTTTTTADPTQCNYTIGQAALGGKIAYILQPGDPGYDPNLQQGLVATVADVYEGSPWGCLGTLISGADGTAIGTGNQNTIDIMAGCATSDIAARLCGDLIEGGYSDWYLPSKDELNKLYLNRVAIGGFQLDVTGIYWSSTEYDNNSAWIQSFYNSATNGFFKNFPGHVRAIRSFACTIPTTTTTSTIAPPTTTTTTTTCVDFINSIVISNGSYTAANGTYTRNDPSGSFTLTGGSGFIFFSVDAWYIFNIAIGNVARNTSTLGTGTWEPWAPGNSSGIIAEYSSYICPTTTTTTTAL